MPRPVQGNHYGAVVSGFFISPTSSVLHTILSTCMGGVEENTDPPRTKIRRDAPAPPSSESEQDIQTPIKKGKSQLIQQW
jgi:hypothetical protein